MSQIILEITFAAVVLGGVAALFVYLKKRKDDLKAKAEAAITAAEAEIKDKLKL